MKNEQDQIKGDGLGKVADLTELGARMGTLEGAPSSRTSPPMGKVDLVDGVDVVSLVEGCLFWVTMLTVDEFQKLRDHYSEVLGGDRFRNGEEIASG